MGQPEATGVDTDLATLRHAVMWRSDTAARDAGLALSRVEAELSRLREDLDALNRERDAGWRTMVEQRDRAEAAEARCARLEKERDEYRIEADHGHDDYEDAEAVIRQIAETRKNQAFDPWARDLCQEFLDRLTESGSAGLPDTPADSPVARTEHKQKGLLTPAQRDELERFVDGQPHQLTGSAASGPARNLVRRNLLTRAPIMAGFYRITEYGRALLGEDTPAGSPEDKS